MQVFESMFSWKKMEKLAQDPFTIKNKTLEFKEVLLVKQSGISDSSAYVTMQIALTILSWHLFL